MSSEQACRKRSKQARRQDRDAPGRFCYAGRSPPPSSAPEDSASREIPFTAEHAPEASAGREIRSSTEHTLRAIARREIRSAAERAPEASACQEMRSGSGVVAKKKFSDSFHYMVRIPCDDGSPCSDDDDPRDVHRNKTTIELMTSSSEESISKESSSEEASVSPGKQKGKEKATVTRKEKVKKGKEKKMNFWELHDAVAASQENIKWLECELYKEKAKKKRLHDALIAASEKAKNHK